MDAGQNSRKHQVVIQAIGILLTCQLAGEVLSQALNLPLPGPVIGLIILILGLFFLGSRYGLMEETIDVEPIGRVSQGLLNTLGIFFVPAAVGTMQVSDVLARYGLKLFVAVAGSTCFTLITTAFLFGYIVKLLPPDKSNHD